jgi:DNA-binding MarR family transcriptional regulator
MTERRVRRVITRLERAGYVRVVAEDRERPWEDRRLSLTVDGQRAAARIDAYLHSNSMTVTRP